MGQSVEVSMQEEHSRSLLDLPIMPRACALALLHATQGLCGCSAWQMTWARSACA